MIILPRHNAVFVSQSRCCTETMHEALQADYGGIRVGDNAHDNTVPWQFRHWYTFAIVRNPFDRVVSLWKWDDMGMTLPEFCRWLVNESVSPLPQAHWLAKVNLTTTLPFERFPECLAWLPFWRGTKVPHRHKTEHKPFTEYITPTIRADIVTWADCSFDKFGYDRDSVT